MHLLTDLLDPHKFNDKQIIIKIAQNGKDMNNDNQTYQGGKIEFDSEAAVTIQGTQRDKFEGGKTPPNKNKTQSLNRPIKGPYFIMKNINQLNREKSKVIKD